MNRYIDVEKIDWRLIIPTNVTIAEENMIHNAKKLVERQPTADVVSKEKYDELNERYHRLLESAKILSDAVREYERREDEQIH